MKLYINKPANGIKGLHKLVTVYTKVRKDVYKPVLFLSREFDTYYLVKATGPFCKDISDSEVIEFYLPNQEKFITEVGELESKICKLIKELDKEENFKSVMRDKEYLRKSDYILIKYVNDYASVRIGYHLVDLSKNRDYCIRHFPLSGGFKVDYYPFNIPESGIFKRISKTRFTKLQKILSEEDIKRYIFLVHTFICCLCVYPEVGVKPSFYLRECIDLK